MQTVKVRLRKPTRVFTFLCSFPLKRHEPCVVRSDKGLEYGVCILPPEDSPPDIEKRLKMTVVRRASEHDVSMYQQLQVEERKAREICVEKIKARSLPMKLVDVEYTFDKQKVVFFFTAADRVDFRDLVRDLARDLKTRIELRHIQVRDEAKILGGIGVCGRELCCSTWLTEFKPISMKMAKKQNLSLNPSKISGQCGRLLCCLSYENDMYQSGKRKDNREEGLEKRRTEREKSPEEDWTIFAKWQDQEAPPFLAGGEMPAEIAPDEALDEALDDTPGEASDAPVEDDAGAEQDVSGEPEETLPAEASEATGEAASPRRRRRGRRGRGGGGSRASSDS